jgi:hypothetical protein
MGNTITYDVQHSPSAGRGRDTKLRLTSGLDGRLRILGSTTWADDHAPRVAAHNVAEPPESRAAVGDAIVHGEPVLVGASSASQSAWDVGEDYCDHNDRERDASHAGGYK